MRRIRPMNRSVTAIAIAAVLSTPVAFAVTPANGGMVGGVSIVVNASPGNQTDPHVSGELAAYTDEASDFSMIRYYDFFNNTAGAISTPFGAAEQLSDVNGNHFAFARQTGLSRSAKEVAMTRTIEGAPGRITRSALKGRLLGIVNAPAWRRQVTQLGSLVSKTESARCSERSRTAWRLRRDTLFCAFPRNEQVDFSSSLASRTRTSRASASTRWPCRAARDRSFDPLNS